MPFCHPELHAHSVISPMQAVGRMGVSPGPGSACQPPHTPPVSARERPLRTRSSACRCLIVTPRPTSVRAFYGVAASQHSVAPLTLYFGDGPRSMIYFRGQWKQLGDTGGADPA